MSSPFPPGVPLSQIPALAPPPGVEPNFTNPESRAPAVLAVYGAFTAIMLIFVALRLYTKAFVTRSFGWEDAACIVGTAMSVGYSGLVVHVFRSGLGPHQWNVPVTVFLNVNLSRELKAVNYLYSPMMIFAKLSILLLYFRLFSVSKNLRIWIYVGIVTTLLDHVIATILYTTLCDTNSDPQCGARLNTVAIAVSVVNVVSDFYVFLLPLLVISKLQMRRAKKVGVSAVFATGFLACVVSVYGLAYRIVTWHDADVSWWLGVLVIVLMLEVNIGLIVGCMPIMPVLFSHERGFKLLGKFLSSLSSRLFSLRSLRSKQSSIKTETKEGRLTMPSEENGIHGTRRQYVELGPVKQPRFEPSLEYPKYEPSAMV